MLVVAVDASVLVGELLRRRGRDLLTRPDLRVLVAEQQWQEAEHELRRRTDKMIAANRLSREVGAELLQVTQLLANVGAIEVVPAVLYGDLEEVARHRVPRDAKDWPTVALAMAFNAGILTADNDFLGCGCPTWTVETLLHELDRQR